MASKNLYYTVKGKDLTEKEKRIYDLLTTKATAQELADKTSNMSAECIKAVLYRLGKVHNLVKITTRKDGLLIRPLYEKVE